MKHVMLDIEAMGIGSDAAIVSIGACKFDPATLAIEWEKFYAIPDKWVGTITPSTVYWWLGQPKEVSDAFMVGQKTPLTKALSGLVGFIGDCSVWGNGVDFGNVIVQEACYREGIKSWSYKQNRCFRTIKNIYDPQAYTKPVIPNHALYDAIAQAMTLVELSTRFSIPL